MLGGWGIGFLLAVAIHPFLSLMGTATVGNLVGLGLMIWIGIRTSRIPVAQILALRQFPPRLCIPLVILAISGSVLIAEVSNWTEEILPIPNSLRQTFLQILRAPDWFGFFVRAILLSLIAPITEELLFRGVFQYGLTQNYGPTKGIILTSICFGVFHITPWQGIGATLIGLLLGLVVHRTGSIFSSMTLHAIWNLLPLIILSAIPDSYLSTFASSTDTIKHIPLHTLAIVSIIFILGLKSFYSQTEPSSI